MANQSIRNLTESNDRLRKVFAPLVTTARDVDERPIREAKDRDMVWVRCTWGEFKAAKAALED